MGSRKNGVNDYAISLDIGNASVGWAAFTPDYHLVRAKGHELIGARLFEPAETAESRRMFRTTRRRLSRRRWRLRLLDALFDAPLADVDPSFLARRKYSWVHPKDEGNSGHWYGGILFDSKDQDKRFYEKYPTIYHLRKALMEDDEQHDIREVYLAVHHILKYRGNFLTEGQLNASNTFDSNDLLDLIEEIIDGSMDESDQSELDQSWKDGIDGTRLANKLCSTKGSRRVRAEHAFEVIQESSTLSRKQSDIVKAIFAGLEGNKLDLAKVFAKDDLSSDDKKALNVYFNKADYEETRNQIVDSGLLDDQECARLDALQTQYSAVALKQLLGDAMSVSESMCMSFDQHQKNWGIIKKELRTSSNADDINKYYGEIVGWKMGDGKRRSIRGSGDSYEKQRKSAYAYFQKLIDASELDESVKQEMTNAIEEDRLFPIQRSSDNGVIPYQLHQNELRLIIEKQGKYYPFLLDTFEKNGRQVNKIEGLLTFRVPYFVGPLVQKDDMQPSDNGENHWMKRRQAGAITPWNFDEMVDKDESGKRFIERLVDTDSYLLGETTLPKNSMLYQEYEVLNELNNVRLSSRSGNHWSNRRRERLGHEDKLLLIRELFVKGGSVSKRAAENVLRKKHGETFELFGLADEKKFMSSMSTYGKMCRVFSARGGEEYVDKHFDLVEKIVELQTVFEDKETLRHQLSMLEGLSEQDCELLCNTHYTGWGRLSKKLLTTEMIERKIGNDFEPRRHSIIELLRAEDRNFMEIITDKQLGVAEWIEEQNQDKELNRSLDEVIDDLRVSPKVKRGIIQSIGLIDDVAKAVGKEPTRIFLELADDVQSSLRTRSRKSRLLDLYRNAGLRREFGDIFERLNDCSDKELQDDRWFLYYTQLGKDMYTGEELDIERLSSAYDIDHIIPQAVTQNDSLDNRVLVARAANARKTDSFTYLPEVVEKQRPFWQKLMDDGLISRVKFERLTRQNEFGKREKERFVERSLVETRQIMKNVATLLRQRYGDSSSVIGLNSELTKEMRRYLGFEHKNRDVNDYHHAQDALCLGVAGQFAINRGFFDNGMVSDGAANSYNQYLQDYLRGYREQLKAGDRRRGKAFGFVVGSMASSDENKHVNPKTGEIMWSDSDKEYLRKVMNYRKMLVTQKVGDSFGALYDATRYGAMTAEGRNGISFDKMKADTSLYGGFSSGKVVYSVLIEAGRKTRLVSITRQEYALLGDRPSNEALKRVLAMKKPEYARAKILLRHIPQMQLIRYKGALAVVKSASELNNARQLWLDCDAYKYFDQAMSGESNVGSNELIEVFDKIMDAVQVQYPLHRVSDEKLPETRKSFCEIGYDDQVAVLKGLVTALHANPSCSNLSAIGLSSNWRRINTGKSGFALSDDDEFIFQSPSGLFEKRVTVAELKRRAR